MTIAAGTDLLFNRFGRLSFVTGADAVQQRAIHHFRFRKGEYFRDTRKGSVIRTELLGGYGILQEIGAIIVQEAEQLEGVDSAYATNQQYDIEDRHFSMTLILVIDKETREITVTSTGAF